MRRGNFPHRKEQKRVEAKTRQEASTRLSPSERLARLDAVFGPDKGAVKERLKLSRRSVKGNAATAVEVVTDSIVLHGLDTIEEPTEGRHYKPRRRERSEKRGS